MNIQELWLLYLLIGVTLAWLTEILANHLENHFKNYELTNQLTWGVRILGILTWPIWLVKFIVNYTITKWKNRHE